MFEAYSICSSGVKMNCEVLPFCLAVAVDSQADGEIHMVRHEGTRYEEGAHRGELIVALASKPVRAQRRPIRRIWRSRQETSLVVMKPATCSSARSALIRFPFLPMASAISASQSIFFMPSGSSISSNAPARQLGAFRKR